MSGLTEQQQRRVERLMFGIFDRTQDYVAVTRKELSKLEARLINAGSYKIENRAAKAVFEAREADSLAAKWIKFTANPKLKREKKELVESYSNQVDTFKFQTAPEDLQDLPPLDNTEKHTQERQAGLVQLEKSYGKHYFFKKPRSGKVFEKNLRDLRTLGAVIHDSGLARAVPFGPLDLIAEEIAPHEEIQNRIFRFNPELDTQEITKQIDVYTHKLFLLGSFSDGVSCPLDYSNSELLANMRAEFLPTLNQYVEQKLTNIQAFADDQQPNLEAAGADKETLAFEQLVAKHQEDVPGYLQSGGLEMNVDLVKPKVTKAILGAVLLIKEGQQIIQQYRKLRIQRDYIENLDNSLFANLDSAEIATILQERQRERDEVITTKYIMVAVAQAKNYELEQDLNNPRQTGKRELCKRRQKSAVKQELEAYCENPLFGAKYLSPPVHQMAQTLDFVANTCPDLPSAETTYLEYYKPSSDGHGTIAHSEIITEVKRATKQASDRSRLVLFAEGRKFGISEFTDIIKGFFDTMLSVIEQIREFLVTGELGQQCSEYTSLNLNTLTTFTRGFVPIETDDITAWVNNERQAEPAQPTFGM